MYSHDQKTWSNDSIDIKIVAILIFWPWLIYLQNPLADK